MGNTFESDATGIVLNDGNGGTNSVAGLTFIDSVFEESSTGVSRPFTSYHIGYWVQATSDVAFIGSTYLNGATGAVTWAGTGQKDVDFGWVLTLTVTDSSGNQINGATVTLKDASGKVLYIAGTNPQGVASLDVKTVHYSGTTNPQPSNEGPATLLVTAAGYADHTEAISLTADLIKNIVLAGL